MSNTLEHLQQTAATAFGGVSFNPERRGKSVIAEFSDELNQDIVQIEQAAHGHNVDPTAAIARYKQKYEAYLTRWLHSQSNCVSTMIAGPSNFPVRRQQKRHQWADNRFGEFREWRRRVLVKIIKSFAPPVTPLTELEKAKADLANRIELQAYMKKVNAAHKAFLKKPESLDASDLPDEAKAQIRSFVPAYSWTPHPYAPYQLQNNNQNIGRLKLRVSELECKASKHEEKQRPEREINGIKVIDNYEADRVQIIFPGKPSESVRAILKKAGWNWSPGNGAWQRKLTPNAQHSALDIVNGITDYITK